MYSVNGLTIQVLSVSSFLLQKVIINDLITPLFWILTKNRKMFVSFYAIFWYTDKWCKRSFNMFTND